jgi:hypothetical protein
MMVYTVIDFEGGQVASMVDKKATAERVGVSIPTLDKYLDGGGYWMYGKILVTLSELEKSGRGSVG